MALGLLLLALGLVRASHAGQPSDMPAVVQERREPTQQGTWADDSAAAAGPIRFDLPAQALRQALNAYSHATGVTIMVDDALVQGMQSTPVQGEFLAGPALQRLLRGTGLQAHYANAGALTLVRRRTATNDAAVAQGGQTAYAVDLQRAVRDRLCANKALQPGAYRAVVQLWMDREGTVRDVRLVRTTGDAPRDARLQAALRGVRTAAVPSGIPQPLTILLRGDRTRTHECVGSAARHD